jgi:cell division septal protein FtsQ
MSTKNKYIWIFILVLIVLSSISIFIFHPYFRIKQIAYNQQNYISNQNLNKHLNKYLEKNIFLTMFRNSIKKELLKTLHQIADISTSIKLPNTIKLKIKEKKPLVSFIAPQKTLLISQDGTILNNEIENVRIDNLDKIMIIRGIPLKYLQGIKITPLLLSKITTILNLLEKYFPNNSFQIEFLSFELDKKHQFQDRIIIWKNDTMPIKLGNLNNIENKMIRLKDFFKIYQQKNRKNIDYIDLRVSNKIIVNYEK